MIRVLLLILMATPAAAQNVPLCAPRGKVIKHLADKYKEQRTWRGITSRGLLELFTAPGGKTWTLVLTAPRGLACLIAAGHSSEFYIPPLEKRH